jgi:hypothetical protein
MQSRSRSFSRWMNFTLGVALLLTLSAGLEVNQALAQSKKTTARVPRGTQMKIRLETTIDSKEARDGDRFTATVLTPSKYADATIEGHLARVEESGKFKGRTSINFVFDRIRYRDGGSAVFGAQVTKVYGEKSVKEVDEEGNVKSGSKGSTTAKRTAGGAAAGAIIGGIIGGGKGAAIGAAVGAGAGAGSVVIQGSNQVKLESGTEMLIRSTR